MAGVERGSPLRYLSLVVFAILAAVALAGFFITRGTYQDQERRLLDERAAEVAALLSDTTNGIATSLRLLGDAYAGSGEENGAVVAAAGSLVDGFIRGAGVAELDGTDIVVTVAQGISPQSGTVLEEGRGDLAQRALTSDGMVSALLGGDTEETGDGAAQSSVLLVSLGRPDGVVAFAEALVDPANPQPRTSGPYRELDVQVYRTPVESTDQLVLSTTREAEADGLVDRRTMAVGAEEWLLVTAPIGSLGGSLVRVLPWMILIGGMGSALLAGTVIEVLVRRRRYAFALVDDRTATLRQAVDELEGARAAADSANRSKSEFLSRMSHELRTPLNAVLGFAQLLELEDLDREQREAVDQILKGGHHLLELINEVLDIARIESGDLVLSAEPVLIAEIVSDALDLIRPLASQRSVHLVGDRLGTCSSYVFADRQRLKQILLNLLSNGVKYNHPGGTVAVTCEQTSPTRARIKVSDTGPGIPAEQLGLLFTPFERLGADRSDIEGTGIGLSLSRRLSEAMGGTVDVETAAGKGSTFWVELPVVEGPVERYERLSAGEEEAPPPRSGRRHTVLYIEDNLANLKLVQRVIAQRGDIEIIPAMQGRLGLDLAHEHAPELILLDLHLPDVSGEDVLQQLRDDPATATTPVVIISADATPSQVQRILAAGAAAYLTKPFDVRELLRLLADALDK